MKKIILFLLLLIIFPLNVLADNSAYLTSLSIDGYNLTPEFNKYNNVYSVFINEEDNTLNINYTLEDNNASVEIIGNDRLNAEENIVNLNVTNNGNTQNYVIYVTKNNSNTVASLDEKKLELNIPKKVNMKLIVIGLVIVWVALAYIFKKIIFFK